MASGMLTAKEIPTADFRCYQYERRPGFQVVNQNSQRSPMTVWMGHAVSPVESLGETSNPIVKTLEMNDKGS